MKTADTCDMFTFDSERVESTRAMIQNRHLDGAAKIFKVLGDRNRTAITYALCENDTLCVCDIATIIDASVATTSHHLRTLYKEGVVTYEKKGKLAMYTLDDDHIRELMMTTLEHAEERKD